MTASKSELKPSDVLRVHRPGIEGLMEFGAVGDLRELTMDNMDLINHAAKSELDRHYIDGYWESRGVIIDPEMSCFYAYSDDMAALREMVQALDNLAFNGYLDSPESL